MERLKIQRGIYRDLTRWYKYSFNFDTTFFHWMIISIKQLTKYMSSTLRTGGSNTYIRTVVRLSKLFFLPKDITIRIGSLVFFFPMGSEKILGPLCLPIEHKMMIVIHWKLNVNGICWNLLRIRNQHFKQFYSYVHWMQFYFWKNKTYSVLRRTVA